jgi:hypothetical protein
LPWQLTLRVRAQVMMGDPEETRWNGVRNNVVKTGWARSVLTSGATPLPPATAIGRLQWG